MKKKVYIGENKLTKIKNAMAGDNVSHSTFVHEDKPPYEEDEYEIGGEGGNNDFFHINEILSNEQLKTAIELRPSKFDNWAVIYNNHYKFFQKKSLALEYKKWLHSNDAYIINLDNIMINESSHADLDYINSISYTVETDEDGNEYYDGEVYDTDGHHLDFFAGDKEDIEYYFQDNLYVAEKIINKDAQKRGNFYWIEDLQDEFVSDMNVDINNVDSVNKAAKRLSKPNGASLFILTDGSVISFNDHAQIQSVCEGMTISKFLELGNIRCGGGNVVSIQLIEQPTFEQQYFLKRMLSYADEAIVDFAVPNKNGNMYPETVHSAYYMQPNASRVVNDIMYYFWEGIKPFGESKKEEGDALNENTFNEWFGKSILVDENGQPIKMYHGTDTVFNEFSKEYIGGHGSFEGYGFNFTPYESRARGYSHENVIEAYLRVENPMTTKTNKISLGQLIKIIAELDKDKPFTDTIVAAYEPAGYGEKWDEKYYRRALPVAARTIYNYNKENEYGDAGMYAELCLNGNADKIKTIELFEKLGYDSAIFYDNSDRLNTVVVFEPNQIKRTTNKTFSNNSNVMDENLEAEVESSEINLDSFKKRETLAPKIWDGFDLNPKVRLKLLDIADDFWDFANITWVKRSGIHLTGSICNFNWSKFSDIDLHIVVNFSEIDERKDFVQEYFDGKKNEWNNEHSKLKIYGFPVELYVEDINAETASGGLYDLEQNDWIKKPSSDSIKPIGLDKYEIKNKSAKLMTSIDDLYDEFNATNDDAELRDIGRRAHKLLNKIKRMRKFGLQRGGESDSFNIIYKVLRRAGYMDMLWSLSSELYDKLNSIGVDESKINEIAERYIKAVLNEEVVADGNADHNPFKKRWKYERETLINYLTNYGEIMTSKENGKEYRVLYDSTLSSRLGINYCICIQWNSMTMEPGNVIYVRAFDKFTRRRFKPEFDYRGYDNVEGTADDVV